MPVVIIYMWSGRSEEFKERIIDRITEVFAEEGIPKSAVSVIIQDVPRENWGVGGRQASKITE